MKNWIKVWWHCLVRTTILKTNHQMSTLTIQETRRVYHFCSCGYLENDSKIGVQTPVK